MRNSPYIILLVCLLISGWQRLLGEDVSSSLPLTGAGIRVSHVPSPSPQAIAEGADVYIGNPSIAIMPDGSYLIAHDIFGNGVSLGDTCTKVFRSTDKGSTWTLMTTMSPLWRVNFFTHEGVVYCIGTGRARNDVDSTLSHLIIRKSTDNGVTWTDGPDEKTDPGYLRTGNTACPSMMVAYEGRIWMGHNLYGFSGNLSLDLMKASSWVHNMGTGSARDASWPEMVYQSFRLWAEGQVVASPATGVVFLPKIERVAVSSGDESVPHDSYVAHTALLKVSGPGADTVLTPATGFVPLPGTGKKFGIAYDSATERFYALTNTVLPRYRRHIDPQYPGSYRPNLTRNTGTLYSSKDLHHWDLEKILIHSDNVDHDAWQYFHFAFDGDDMIIASRTALRTEADDYDPPRGHDSNLLTFHRIPGYATVTPMHTLKLEDGVVQRYEITDYQDAPLGNFVLGVQPKTPSGIARANERLYIQQQDGRVISYDLHGNFIEELANIADDLEFLPFPFSFAQNKTSQKTWTYPQSGEWYDPRNWHYWNRPDIGEEEAFFGSAIVGDAIINLNQTHHLGGISFRSPHSYTISKGSILSYNVTAIYDTGGIILAGEGLSLINNYQGNHRVEVPITNERDCRINLAEGSSLNLTSTFTQNANISVHIDLGHELPAAPAITIQRVDRINPAATLTFVVDRIPLLNDSTFVLAYIGNAADIPDGVISVVSPTGRALPYELSEDGFVTLPLSYPDPASLSMEELLAYAFTEDSITDTRGAQDHLPVVDSSSGEIPTISFTPYNSLLLYEVQQSSDLMTWTTIASISGGSSERVLVESNINRYSGNCIFLRVKIAVKPKNQ